MITKETWKKGFKSGLEVTWKLSKVILPVYFAVTILKYTPILPWLSHILEPMMVYLGLPGEAALPLVMGYLLNLYAGIGAMLALTLTTKQITILGGMLLMCHSLPVETSISWQTGARVRSLLAARFATSILAGLLLNWLL